jgi:hypothetical protein
MASMAGIVPLLAPTKTEVPFEEAENRVQLFLPALGGRRPLLTTFFLTPLFRAY